MNLARKPFLILGLLAGLAGCHEDRPHDYGRQRPDVGSLHPDDSGLQSKDVVSASDQMSQELLRVPELNSSPQQRTVVVTGMENDTTNRRDQYDIFLKRVKANVASEGRGRVRLIENRDRYHYLQSRELEPTGDPRTTPPGPAGVQPQFALHGEVDELPNRATNYYLFLFNLTDLRSREVVWTRKYEVKVAR